MPKSDLPRPTAPPWRPAAELRHHEPVCANCWCYERPVSKLTGVRTDLAGFSPEEIKSLDAYLQDAGFCTLYPPITGPNYIGVQPITHASYRCASFTHVAAMKARVAAMAQGREPE